MRNAVAGYRPGEFGNLAKIPDDYPKFVISMDPMAGGDRGGIRHLPLREFLLHGNGE